MDDQLLDAVERGDVGRARTLLLNGASPHEDQSGLSLLDQAIAHHDQQMASLLVEHGARLDEADEQGRTRLHTAVSGSDDPKTTRLLLLLGLDPNAADRHGWTPLHYAAAHGYDEVVAVLLAGGANREAVTAEGKRPADLARADGHARLPL